MSKAQMIDQIQQINRSAARDWLDLFTRSELGQYLAHLQLTLEPRGSDSRWIPMPDMAALAAERRLW